MSPSFAGSGPGSADERTNRSRVGTRAATARTGSHSVAGESSGANSTFRGPVRRSSVDASVRGHDSAIIARSASVLVTWASFSASANVADEMAGPLRADVPNATGAPGVDGAAGKSLPLGGCSPRQAAATETKPRGALRRNWRRVFTSGAHEREEKSARRALREGSPSTILPAMLTAKKA